MGYTKYGPFTDGSAPYLSAAYNNGLENFLVTVNSAATDSNITSDGSGNLNIPNTAYYKIGGFQIMNSPSNGDLIINVPNVGGSHKFYVQVGGVNKFSIDSSGNVRAAGTITASVTP